MSADTDKAGLIMYSKLRLRALQYNLHNLISTLSLLVGDQDCFGGMDSLLSDPNLPAHIRDQLATEKVVRLPSQTRTYALVACYRIFFRRSLARTKMKNWIGRQAKSCSRNWRTKSTRTLRATVICLWTKLHMDSLR